MKASEVEKKLGYVFKDKNLLRLALTLPSASAAENNQRLEFFGDAILEFIASEQIFLEGNSEGVMTERRQTLVSDAALSLVTKRLGLDEHLIRGKNDITNKKAIPSAYEAVVAAIYIDGGLARAKKFVLATLDFESRSVQENYKGKLQEKLQSEGKPPPVYRHEDLGTQQNHKFVATLNLFGEKFTGEAECIKSAEQLAARAALEYRNSKHR